MNRRSFLASCAAMAASAMVPTWLKPAERPRINLQAFCGDGDCLSRHGEMRSPFVQGDAEKFRYATNGRICVRVAESDEFDLADSVARPPASRLDWVHDQLTGWKSWPRRNPLEMRWSDSHAQAIGHTYIDVEYDEMIRRELGDAEYRLFRGRIKVAGRPVERDVVLFRFHGGTGILCPLSNEVVESRLLKG